jgi:hypothetical protein
MLSNQAQIDKGRTQSLMSCHNSVSFGARFLSDNDRDITYAYSSQYNKFDLVSAIGSELKMSKIESTGNYNAMEDN